MKASLTTSAIVHVSVLAMALVSLGSPAPLDVADVEALPVELVPIEEISQIQQGERTAPLAERSAPKPTARPEINADAQNLGDNDIDLKSPPTPSTRPSNNETAAAPPKQENPQPVVDDRSNDVKEIVKEETSAPQEVAALPQQKPDVTPPTPRPDPVPEPVKETPPEPAPAEAAPAETPAEAALPDNVPVPVVRPRPPERPAEPKPAERAADKPAEQKTAQSTPVAKPSERTPGDRNRETAKSASSKESDFNADELAILLNKNQSSGGGAKRSTEQAALGGRQTTGGSKLSQTEMDALRGIIQKNWQIIPGMVDAGQVRIKVTMKLDRSGEIIGQPKVEATGGTEGVQRALAGGALRAVKRSAPFTSLPADKYDAWSEVIVNFDPSELL